MEKFCPRCKELKDSSDFYLRGKNRTNELSSYCKVCLNKAQMFRWKKRKQQAIAYKGGLCMDCNHSYPLEVFQFHHRDPKEKEFNWNKTRQLSWVKVLKEIDKCDLLCANCHILRHSKDISEYEANDG